MPITYANVNPMYCKLAHYYFSPYEILWICENAVE
jgi:hypothetical protein